MTVAEAIRLGLRRLRVNKLRTGLTALGIVIGVGSLVTLIAVGQGAQQRLTDRIASLGTNLLSVQPGATVTGGVRGAAGSAATLTPQDGPRWRGCPASRPWPPSCRWPARSSSRGARTRRRRSPGTTPAEARVRGYDVQTGEFVTSVEQARGLRTAVLGPSTAEDLGTAVGRQIEVDGVPFQVVGITQPKGGGRLLIPTTS